VYWTSQSADIQSVRHSPRTDRSTQSRDRRQLIAALEVGIAMSAFAAGLYALSQSLGDEPHRSYLRFGGFFVAVGFAAAESLRLNIQKSRETRAVTLSEVPFVVGLLLISPTAFIVGRIIGGSASIIATQRMHRSAVKFGFNVVLFGCEAVIGVALLRCLDMGTGVHSPWSWSAAVVGAVVSSALAGLAVAVLIELIEGRPSMRRLGTSAVGFIPQSFVIAVLGLEATLITTSSRWAVVPLTAGLLVLAAAYRSYAALAERHSTLELVHDFTRELTNQAVLQSLETSILDQCCRALRAEKAHLALIGADLSPVIEEFANGAEPGAVSFGSQWFTNHDRWLVAQVVTQARPALLSTQTRDSEQRKWLARNGLADAIVVPVRRGDRVDAMLAVGNRLGDTRSFDDGDLRVLEAISAQAGVSLGNDRLREQLAFASLHDPATGIPNRMYLERTLTTRLASPDTHRVAVVMIGLDAMKQVTEVFGHHHGDAVIREVAKRLSDRLNDRGEVTRFGSGELAVVVSQSESLEALTLLVDQLIQPLAAPILVESTAIDVMPRAGVAAAVLHADNAADLIRCADAAMSAARSAGVQVAVHDPRRDTSSKDRLAMVALLRQSILAEQIDIHVQPKARAADGRITSVEALARWRHVTLGTVPPVEFIPIAEHSGLIRPLTELVLDKALRACATWQPAAPGVGVAVNVSAQLLVNEELCDVVDRLLRRHDVDADLLTIEITESGLMSDAATTAAALHRLRTLGVSLSVDDFGTGYSSLAYLHQLPVTEVKIDQSFVRRMSADHHDVPIVRAIVELGHSLGLSVVAEGVEDRRVYDALVSLGVDVLQGYHIARPMPADDFAPWAATYSPAWAAPLSSR
jgi:diguanylate cyclase (GGDEF)-like protein